MINTSCSQKPKDYFAASQHRRPQDILYEESIFTLTDGEYTSLKPLSSQNSTSKRRKLQPGSAQGDALEFRTEASPCVVVKVRDEEYEQLRLQLVDNVAKAMQLDFHNLPMPGQEGSAHQAASNSNMQTDQSCHEQLMIKRTFFKPFSDGAMLDDDASQQPETIKLLRHEYYLAVPSSGNSPD